jgi:4-amino-4-deoxy-L-arabinose transferase-like glycosyltransferase
MTLRLSILLSIIFIAHLIVAVVSRNGIIQDDAESYTLIGRNLAHGNGFVFEAGRTPTSWRAPAYPCFLSLIFRMFHDSYFAARIAQAFLWTVTSLMVFFVARVTVGVRYSPLVCALTGFNPTFLGLTGVLYSESLLICFFVLSVLGICYLHTSRKLWVALLCGCAVGLSILTRSTALILIPALWTMFVVRRFKPPVWPYLVATLTAVLMVGIWTARNWEVHHRFILVESNAGLNLFHGSRPYLPPIFIWKALERVKADPELHRLTDGKSEGDACAALQKAALASIATHPLRMISRVPGKAFDFWLPDFFVPGNVRAGSYCEACRLAYIPISIITAFWFILIALAAGFYIFKNRRQWYVLLFVVIGVLYTIPHLIVYGASRYHEPLTVLLTVLSAPVVGAIVLRGRSLA